MTDSPNTPRQNLNKPTSENFQLKQVVRHQILKFAVFAAPDYIREMFCFYEFLPAMPTNSLAHPSLTFAFDLLV